MVSQTLTWLAVTNFSFIRARACKNTFQKDTLRDRVCDDRKDLITPYKVNKSSSSTGAQTDEWRTETQVRG